MVPPISRTSPSSLILSGHALSRHSQRRASLVTERLPNPVKSTVKVTITDISWLCINKLEKMAYLFPTAVIQHTTTEWFVKTDYFFLYYSEGSTSKTKTNQNGGNTGSSRSPEGMRALCFAPGSLLLIPSASSAYKGTASAWHHHPIRLSCNSV